MELQTERLKLIPCTDYSISTIAPEEYKIGPHIESHIKDLKDDPILIGWGAWLVINKESNMIIGDVGFKGKPNEENIVEVGYGISSTEQGKGYATEAVRAIIRWAFLSNKVTKVVAECTNDNIPSIKVLEKLQMHQVGEKGDMLNWELLR